MTSLHSNLSFLLYIYQLHLHLVRTFLSPPLIILSVYISPWAPFSPNATSLATTQALSKPRDIVPVELFR